MPESQAPPEDGVRLRSIVEALVFAAEEPLTLDDLQDLFPDAGRDDLQAAVDDVVRRWDGGDRGLQIIQVAGGYRMTTRAEHGEWVRALFRSRNRRRLSAAALETLAIVAYRQPITTPEIQAIRGTDPGGVLQTLLDKRLLRVVGRKKVVGKPILYATTHEFLSHFGLNSLSDLPTLEEFGSLAASLNLPAPPEGAALAEQLAGPFEEEEEAMGPGGEEFEDATEDESEHDEDGDDS